MLLLGERENWTVKERKERGGEERRWDQNERDNKERDKKYTNSFHSGSDDTT